jgi:D-alanine transaminase
MCSEFTRPPAKQVTDGVATISLGDERWMNCDIKSVSLLGNVLARQAAVDEQAMEAILFRDGFLTEGAASTVWVVRHNKLLVPLKDRRILQGIRIGLIEEMCESESIELEHRNITREEVLQADELILSSATKEVVPVTSLDGNSVGNGKPGPILAKLHNAYQHAVAKNAAGQAA